MAFSGPNMESSNGLFCPNNWYNIQFTIKKENSRKLKFEKLQMFSIYSSFKVSNTL